MPDKIETISTRIMKHFDFLYENDKGVFYKCLISDECESKQFNGRKKYNLVAHAKTHTKFFSENYKIEATTTAQMSYKRLHFIQACAEMVTVNGLPFSALNKSGFRKAVADKLQELENANLGDGLVGNCPAIKEHISYLSSEIIETIKKDVNGKFVSLMVDTATKFRRSILGLSLQFLCGTSIVIRSIGMVHLDSSHTSKYIADKILDQLKLFGIQIWQIISITTDNASNMTAMINRCNQIYNAECADYEDEIDAGEHDEDHQADDQNLWSAGDSEYVEILQRQYTSASEEEVQSMIADFLDEIDAKKPDEIETIPKQKDADQQSQEEPIDINELICQLEEIFSDVGLNISGIRCAVHTLQLAVIGALRTKNYKLLIRLCREVCKELRKQTTHDVLKANNIPFKIPSIDCLTRWNSTYKMLCDLIQYCKSAIVFLASRKKAPKCFELMLVKWSILTDILAVLKLPYDLTMGIQNSSYTLSDFFGGWIEMVRKLEKMQDDEFATNLLKHTKVRETALLNNSSMLAAVYLDPRYRFLLSPSDVKTAKIVLETLHDKFRRAESQLSEFHSQSLLQPNTAEDSFEEYFVAKGLERTFHGDNVNQTDLVANDMRADMTIWFAAYEKIVRIHRKNSIFEFWEVNSSEHKGLYELARIIMAIPPSQTTVERAFSLLGYIYNCRRTRLLPENLEKIMMIILNRDLVEQIHQSDLNALL